MKSDPWSCIAKRGAFTMVVLTRARAAIDGHAMHAEAMLMAVFIPDDGSPTTHVGFVSLEDLGEFTSAMAPHGIAIRCAPGEDVAALRTLLVAGTLH